MDWEGRMMTYEGWTRTRRHEDFGRGVLGGLCRFLFVLVVSFYWWSFSFVYLDTVAIDSLFLFHEALFAGKVK
jgi:hypothetical protein